MFALVLSCNRGNFLCALRQYRHFIRFFFSFDSHLFFPHDADRIDIDGKAAAPKFACAVLCRCRKKIWEDLSLLSNYESITLTCFKRSKDWKADRSRRSCRPKNLISINNQWILLFYIVSIKNSLYFSTRKALIAIDHLVRMTRVSDCAYNQYFDENFNNMRRIRCRFTICIVTSAPEK